MGDVRDTAFSPSTVTNGAAIGQTGLLPDGTIKLFNSVVELCLNVLKESADRDAPVVEHRSAADLQEELADVLQLPREGQGLSGLTEQLETVVRFSPRTCHVHFYNQLFAGFDVASIVADFVTTVLNTTSYTFEIGPATTLIEKRLIERLCKMVGFQDGEGVFAPGGSASNLLGFLLARHRAVPKCRKQGVDGQRLVCFTSAQGHYSLSRAAMIGGLGMNAVVKVRCDNEGRMLISDLEDKIVEAKAAGKRPFMVVATAGTTVLGQFDPIQDIARVCEENALWFHIDGCLGSSVLFSEKHKHLMAGCELADSVAWNPHKMLGIGLQCSCILVKQRGLLRKCNSSHADYLFHPEAVDLDVGDMTLQCGRRVDTLKLWLSWKAHGDLGFASRVDEAFQRAEDFHKLVEACGGRFVNVTPSSASVCSCFWVLPPGQSQWDKDRTAVSEYAHALRKTLMKRGLLLMNYQPLKDQGYPYFFRIVTHNPAMLETDCQWVLDEFLTAMELTDKVWAAQRLTCNESSC